MERGNEDEHLDHILSSSTPAQLETQTTAPAALSASASVPAESAQIHRRSSSRAQHPVRLTRARQKLVEEGHTHEPTTGQELDIPVEAEGSTRRKRKFTRFSLPDTGDRGEGSISSKKRKSATATALIASPFDIDRKGKKRAAPSSSPPVKTSTGSSSARHHKRPRVTAPGDIGRYSLRQKVPSPDDQSAQQSKSKGKGKGKATVGTKKKFSASMPKKANPRQKRAGPSLTSAEGTRKGSASKLHIDDPMDDDESHWLDDSESAGEMLEDDQEEDEPMHSSENDEEDEDDEESDEGDITAGGSTSATAGGSVLGGLSAMGGAGLHFDEATAAAIFGGDFGSIGSLISGLSNRLKRLRTQLHSRSITKRLAALRECSELLLVSNEDTLGGSFSVTGFATDFIAILDGKPIIDAKRDDDDDKAGSAEMDEDAQLAAALAMSTGGGLGDAMGNEEEMECQLVACRCLAHLLEALPGTAHALVDLGAVPALCSKLNEISYIELAEQTLSTMEKISAEHPAAIVREGGLAALLNYLPFFSTNVQRTAVTAAANCCKNISKEYFAQIRDVFPILREVLTQGDQRLVEQATLAVLRTVESYRHSAESLEGLLTVDTVVAINALLMPSGGSPLLTPSTFTHLLRALTSSARRSAKVTVAFLEAGITNTLYQILTGVLPSAHEGDDQGQGASGQGLAGGVADMAVLQNLAHRPKEHIEESLALICELLPPSPPVGVFDSRGYTEKALARIKKGRKVPQQTEKPSRRSTRLGESSATPGSTGPATPTANPSTPVPGSALVEPNPAAALQDESLKARKESEDQLQLRIELLSSQPDLVGRFVRLLVPVLVDVYAASVAMRVRSKVLQGLIKAISFAQQSDLLETLKLVPMASFLCAIISTKNNSTAVLNALQLVELLATKLPDVYQVSFQREGVVFEIEDLAAQELKAPAADKKTSEDTVVVKIEPGEPSTPTPAQATRIATSSTRLQQLASQIPEELRPMLAASTLPSGLASYLLDPDSATPRASSSRRGSIPSSVDQDDANIIRARIILAKKIFEADGEQKNAATAVLDDLKAVVTRLCLPQASDGELRDALRSLALRISGAGEALSSFELLKGGLVDGLLDFADTNGTVPAIDRRSMLFDIFSDSSISSPTPIAVLVKLLHESLGRLENFEVETAFSGLADTSRATTSLARSMKVRIQAEEGQDIPKQVSNMMISIPAIAQFSQLNDYMRPKIANGNFNPTTNFSNMFAAYASGMAGPRGGAPTATGGPPGSAAAAASRMLSALSATRPGASGAFALGSGETAGSAIAGPSDSARMSGLAIGDQSFFNAFASSAPESSRLALPPPSASAGGTSSAAPVEPPRRRSARLSGQNLPTSGTASVPLSTPAPVNPALSSSAPESSGLAGPEPTILPPMPMDLDFEDDDDYSDEEYAEEVFEEEMDEEIVRPQEKVVNMSVAPDGSGVVAKTPEGTRIATPNQAAGAGPSTALGLPGPSGAATPRSASYAGAVKAQGGDWHLQFSLNGNKVAMDDTIYGATHKYIRGSAIAGTGSYGNPVHVKFSKVDGPAPKIDNAVDAPSPASLISAIPAALDDSTATSKILRLLRLIHHLTIDAKDISSRHDVMDLNLFVNNKLTAKLTRQLEEVMIIASNCLPDWAVEITKHFSFLFPFETRYSFLSSTSFGYQRLLSRFVNANQSRSSSISRRDDISHLGRTQRQKVRISRSQLLYSCAKVMELYGMGQWILEVEYFEEIGTGLGPTLEFYSIASREFAQRALGIWRDDDESAPGLYVRSLNGLFPAPLGPSEPDVPQQGSKLNWFKTLGIFVGRALLDSRIIDVNLNKVFLRLILGREVKKNIATLRLVDKTLALSLERLQGYLYARKEIEALQLPPGARRNKLAMLSIGGAKLADMSLDFTLPGYPDIELKPGGAHTDVDDHNLDDYLEKVLDMMLGSGVERQARAFAEGFSMIFPMSDMKIFSPDELGLLFGNAEEDWSRETIEHAIKADHGYNLDSRAVQNLLEVMVAYEKDERRHFLQFITGAPKLPIGGFRGLTPPFTVVRKPHEQPFRADDYLPSVMTCAQYLKLPDYSSKEVLASQLKRAMLDGGGSFHLS